MKDHLKRNAALATILKRYAAKNRRFMSKPPSVALLLFDCLERNEAG